MKALTLAVTLMISGLAFANNCEDKVLADYIKAVPQNEFHHLTGEVIKLLPAQKSFKAYGVTVVTGFNKATDVYMAASEYMSGYGVEALVVDPETCETLKMENVYTE